MNNNINSTPVEQPVNVPQNNPVPPQNNNSSNKNFVITILVVVILVALASGGTVYFITSSRNNNNTNETTDNNNNNQTNQENNNGSSNQNNNEQPNKPTPVTLSDEELDKYLSYIPMGDISFLDNGVKSAFEVERTTVTEYDKKVLIQMSINQLQHTNYFENKLKFEVKECTTYCPKLNEYGGNYDIAYDLTPLEKPLHAMYNLSLNSLDLNVLNANNMTSASGESYEYFDGGIVVWQGMGAKNGTNILNKYETNTDELIIYSYREVHNLGYDTIRDAYTNKEFTITDDDYETYVKNHKNEFTQYKSVFKKNDTGYYWYSTEVVK